MLDRPTPEKGKALKPWLTALGFAVLIVGLFWFGQGIGYIRWPHTSFMIGAHLWMYIGTAVAAAGLWLVVFSRGPDPK